MGSLLQEAGMDKVNVFNLDTNQLLQPQDQNDVEYNEPDFTPQVWTRTGRQTQRPAHLGELDLINRAIWWRSTLWITQHILS